MDNKSDNHTVPGRPDGDIDPPAQADEGTGHLGVRDDSDSPFRRLSDMLRCDPRLAKFRNGVTPNRPPPKKAPAPKQAPKKMKRVTCAESKKLIPPNHGFYLASSPISSVVLPLSCDLLNALHFEWGYNDDFREYEPGDVVIYNATADTDEEGYALMGTIQIGTPQHFYPASIAKRKFPTVVKHLLANPSKPEPEYEVTYQYAAPGATRWHGEYTTREEAAAGGLEHFPGPAVRTRKVYRRTCEEETHERIVID